jgi:sialate O-acetylesterase
VRTDCPTLVRRTAVLFVFTSIAAACASAAPALPGFFTDNMVLQRDKPAPVWGWAEPGEEVTVEFAGQKKTVTADEHGRWMVRLDAMEASAEGRVLAVGESVKLSNVLVGDVWLCSGQSNMAMTVNRVRNAKEEIPSAKFPLIRHIRIPNVTAGSPRDDTRAKGMKWTVCSPNTAPGFTAAGFFFARKLHRELEIPIGLLHSSWGGTMIEPWTAPEGFAMVPELKALSDRLKPVLPNTEEGRAAHDRALKDVRKWVGDAEKALEAKRAFPPLPRVPSVPADSRAPTAIYNAMIHPLIPFAIRGAIWYQGESNGREGKSYFHKMQALTGGWRALWKQGDFPFYFVQLASFQKPTDVAAGGDGWAMLREAQRKSLSITNTGMAVIIDIGEARDIHPKNKQDVGLRLALWALAGEYGRKDVIPSGPLYKSHKAEGNALRIEFDYTGSGLMVGKKDGLSPAAEVPDGTLKRFAVAGEDRRWFWADAKIDGDTVVLSSPAVAAPVAARYAFSMNPEGCNLYNREGLPASPFRTDDWQLKRRK